MPQGITLLPNKYYKIKLAGASKYAINGWSEASRYIRTFTNQNSINATNPTQNIFAENISLRNTTINNNIEVIAGNSIEVFQILRSIKVVIF